ncbi:response regulator transcription factor [Clostridium botulinum]|nr:response regulator transcription factor [Clostridium botulinum]
MNEKILIIEDDEVIREELQNFLIKYGYEVKAPIDLNNIIKYVENEHANLILLDINLPLYDGYYICREIRKTSDVPIIIVTSRDSDVDELMSINLGADDFITKPYNTEILLARITNILKRTYGNLKTNNILNYRDFNLNLSNATVIYKDKSLELTKNEVKILSYLINNKGNIVKRDLLMEYLWKSDYFVDDSTLTVNINRLRKKLQEIGIENPIETRRGLGYIMP